jgi:hypothetical protein
MAPGEADYLAEHGTKEERVAQAAADEEAREIEAADDLRMTFLNSVAGAGDEASTPRARATLALCAINDDVAFNANPSTHGDALITDVDTALKIISGLEAFARERLGMVKPT